MESEERALPEQETPAVEAEIPLPATAAPAEGWEEQAPAAQELPGTPLAQFALEQELARGRRLLDEQLRIIQAVDPAVKSLADLRTQPEFSHFDKLVKSGMTISDARSLITSHIDESGGCGPTGGHQRRARQGASGPGGRRPGGGGRPHRRDHPQLSPVQSPVDPRPDRGLPPQLQTRSVRACFVSTSGPSATWSPLSICPARRG